MNLSACLMSISMNKMQPPLPPRNLTWNVRCYKIEVLLCFCHVYVLVGPSVHLGTSLSKDTRNNSCELDLKILILVT